MKDMYYSFLPLFCHEPELFKKGILWFSTRSVRFRRNRKVFEERYGELWRGGVMEGGISHSLSNSLTPVLMAGMYFRVTGDTQFFDDNPEIIDMIRSLLEEVETTRWDRKHLYPSTWISDGQSRGDYHTGSNLTAWYAFFAASRIMDVVAKDQALAERYQEIAARIKEDLDGTNIVEGSLGRQYVEGVDADGTVIWGHDGEESDTTLMPFYGYADYDDAAYQNHCRAAMTPSNPYYRPSTGGINFGRHTDATFPGFVTGLAGVRDGEEMANRMGAIRRLTDVDGSVWWWPYRKGDSGGSVTRAIHLSESQLLGKCGWASGVFAAHFVSQILGISFDARTSTLSLRPFSPCSDYRWENFPMCHIRFTVEFRRRSDRLVCEVENLNDTDITARIELPVLEQREPSTILVDGETTDDYSVRQFFDFPSIETTFTLQAGRKGRLEVLLKSPASP
jgi:hypothetical protein